MQNSLCTNIHCTHQNRLEFLIRIMLFFFVHMNRSAGQQFIRARVSNFRNRKYNGHINQHFECTEKKQAHDFSVMNMFLPSFKVSG